MARFSRRLQQAANIKSAPSLPDTTVSVTNVTSTTVTLNWTGVAGATGYFVGRDGTDTNGNGPWSNLDPSSARSRVFISLAPNTTYTFYCEPRPGGARKSIQVTTAIDDTTVFVTNITATTATLNWTSVDGATGYLVGRNGTDSNGNGPWSTTLGSSATSQTFTSLVPNTTYTLYCTPQPGGSQESIQITTADDGQTQSWDWSDSNLPWAYSTTSAFTADWPSGVTVVDIQTGSPDFYTNLQNTVNAAGKRVVVRLGVGVYHLKSFRMIGSSGSPTYAFGFWFPNLQGLLGQGPDKTYVQMDAGSVNQAQLDAMSQMTSASFAPLQMGFARFDGLSSSSPVLLAGLTFRGDDQPLLTDVASDVPAYAPQPAPYNGIVIYSGSYGKVSHVRFQASGHAMTSSPPFELACISTQKGNVTFNNCEFDGRLSPDLDPARPRRCTTYMGNNESLATHTDCWFHHSNVSRYAVNDQNANTTGTYSLVRCKAEQITNTHNTDPAQNNGNSLGGYTNACLFGWESCNGTINITDCIMSVDNPYTDVSISQDLQFTSVGSRDPQGGRLTVTRGVYRNTAWPTIDGYLSIRAVTGTYWYRDGFNTTMNITNDAGVRKQPYIYTASWPPSTATLNAAGVTPDTHYIVRTS